MAEDNKSNVSQFNKGLYLDNSNLDSPKGTYKYALNTVNETELGDSGFISNEESNELCYDFGKKGKLLIGKVYIGENRVVVFSVSENNSVSEIGVLNTEDCTYKTIVEDSNSPEKLKLKFSITNQIQATYRLRKGCERTVYFTDDLNPPRYFNIDKPNQFKTSGNWDTNKFSLFKRVTTFPKIGSIEVLDTQGALIPGSYGVLVQHLDEDLNGTEFYELVKNINIYNDSLSKSYSDIEGSSRIDSEGGAYLYDKSSKAIKLSLSVVDSNFTYIRYAFVERTSGSGEISKVVYSEPISVSSTQYIYTGENGSTTGTIEEVELFNKGAGIHKAKHIEQIDNMLMLSNITGEQAKMCKLQKYASKINVDCFVKEVILTSVKDGSNPKNPLVDYNGVGYQPGEIYSLGVQYVFEDYSLSPVFHIPGKPSVISDNFVYSVGDNVHPMKSTNNTNTSERYIDSNSSCEDNDYWGKDSNFVSLKNRNVRHHRFPTRDDIKIGFVKRKDTIGNSTTFKMVQLNITGQVKVSDESSSYVAEDFVLVVSYKVNGVDTSYLATIYPDDNIVPSLTNSITYNSSDVISDIKLYSKAIGGDTQTEITLTDSTSAQQANGLTYRVTVGTTTENNQTKVMEVPILGIKLSNIELPDELEIGKKVIGYQVLRQERTDLDKTILDSGVVFPMQVAGKNVTTGLLAPEFLTKFGGVESTCEGSTDPTYPTCYNISPNNFMVVSPGHKFMDKTYDSFTSIIQVGNYKKQTVSRSATSSQNVYEGTSATGEEDKKTSDSDGFSLRHGYRFTEVEYEDSKTQDFKLSSTNTRVYNLNALNYADTESGTETLYNLASDNKALVFSTSDTSVNRTTYGPSKKNFPYVYLRKESETFYQNFRNKPYYLVSGDVFSDTTCYVFGGDTYVAPLRYSNHIFGNAAAALRRKKVSTWALIGSIVVALVGTALAIFSGGTSLLIAGGILTALGAIATGAAALVEVDKFNELYGDKWQANLDKTLFDFYYARLFIREHPDHRLENYEPDPLYLSWADDTFRWWGETVGDLWFETQLNIGLRVPPKSMENNYLKPLKPIMNDRTSSTIDPLAFPDYIKNNTVGSGRFHRYKDLDIPPVDPIEWYFMKKVTTPKQSSTSGVEYQGVSTPQVYLVNPDHFIHKGVTRFYTIPLEYDCCSDCTEKFPHRVFYSQQSFQEEKADNYRMFLPNNYRDIEGETGEITNMFRLAGNLFIHTEEALWKMGRKYQERVTDNIVSFIGTGSYFEVPPVRMIDDDTGNSAGCQHKWSTIKTPYGVFFVSANQGKIYQFDSEKLKPISDIGLSNWFRNNISINADAQFYKVDGEEFPYKDNPSNILGTGFISTYDSAKERIIFTKKDRFLKGAFLQPDDEVYTNGNEIVVFDDLPNIIREQQTLGWTYLDRDREKLRFFRDVVKTRTEIREVTVNIASDSDIIVHFDMSGSFNSNTREQIATAITAWYDSYKLSNPNWKGECYFLKVPDSCLSQRNWNILEYIKVYKSSITTIHGTTINANHIFSKNLVGITFVNENARRYCNNNEGYHLGTFNEYYLDTEVYSDFRNDYLKHKENYEALLSTGGSFNGLAYPIVFSNTSYTIAYLRHVMRAIKGTRYTTEEFDSLPVNPFVSTSDFNIIRDSLTQPFEPYPSTIGLGELGWKAIYNRGTNNTNQVMTPEQFGLDMESYLADIQTTVLEEVTVQYTEREYKYIEGTKISISDLEESNNSWTISYSLKNNSWVSWHSYLPNMYINTPNRFLSWQQSINGIYKHGVIGNYQTYYGIFFPHVIDYISVSNPLITKLYESFSLRTEAYNYHKDSQEYAEERYTTFNKMIVYNSRQCSGQMNLLVKDDNLSVNYLRNQVKDLGGNISVISKFEKDWFINDFRDIRIDYTKPIWNSNVVWSDEFRDKDLNTDTLDINKNWMQLESFRDKYLAVRLIFDNFADKKLITNFSIENEQQSIH